MTRDRSDQGPKWTPTSGVYALKGTIVILSTPRLILAHPHTLKAVRQCCFVMLLPRPHHNTVMMRHPPRSTRRTCGTSLRTLA